MQTFNTSIGLYNAMTNQMLEATERHWQFNVTISPETYQEIERKRGYVPKSGLISACVNYVVNNPECLQEAIKMTHLSKVQHSPYHIGVSTDFSVIEKIEKVLIDNKFGLSRFINSCMEVILNPKNEKLLRTALTRKVIAS